MFNCDYKYIEKSNKCDLKGTILPNKKVYFNKQRTTQTKITQLTCADQWDWGWVNVYLSLPSGEGGGTYFVII